MQPYSLRSKKESTMRALPKPLIAAAVITAILGTLAHFAFDLSGQNRLVGLVSATNESTWEHMKLLFFPMLLTSILLTWRLRADYPCILPSLLIGNFVGTFLIPVLFYTYSGILGRRIDAINIAIYYICVIAAFYIAFRLASRPCSDDLTRTLLLLTFVMILLFFMFSYYPPELGIFADPQKKITSLSNHR